MCHDLIKMRKNILIIFSAFFIMYLPCEAQIRVRASNGVVSQNRSDIEKVMNEYFKAVKSNSDPSDNLAGSPYLTDDFQVALLVFPKGNPISAKIRYNIAKEEMQVKMDEEDYRVLHPGVVVKINDNPYKMLSYRGEDKTVDLIGYFEILTPETATEEAKLLRKYKKTVRSGKAAAAMRKATPARYVDQDDFYIQFGNFKPIEAERSNKRFIESFPEAHQDAVKDFMKENKLKSRDEQDLKRIIEFYNAKF